MKQRLALATALLGDPRVLVLDEPANGLDPEGIAWLRAFLRGFARQGRTVLVSSHLLAEVEQGVDHLVVIDGGRCVYQGALEQLRGAGRARVLVRCPDPVRLAQALAAAGVVEIDTLPDGRLGRRRGGRGARRRRRARGGCGRARPGGGAGGPGADVPAARVRGAVSDDACCTSRAARARSSRLRAEWRRVASTRLWWGLLIPVVALALLVNLFGGLLGDELGDGGGFPVLPASVAFTLTLTVVFAAVYGTVAAAGEFRHRTVTTAYLTAGGRGRVLVGKLVAGACVGALYAVVAVLVGVAAGVLGQGAGPVPGAEALAGVAAVGVTVAALWGVLGAALGILLANQVGALVALLVYLQIGELVLAAVLNNSGSPALARLTPYLPGNAGDVAIYDFPARALAGPGFADQLVEELAGVTAPPPWWGALSVLAGWAALAAVIAWTVGDRRDVT